MKALALVTFLLIFFAITGLYFFVGSNGEFYYDDISPLSALAQINDIDSALVYIFSNTSGPTGRPISMASFILNIGDWSNNDRAFFQINSIIHALNALFVFCITALLTRLLSIHTQNQNLARQSFWIASITAIFWYVLPIHAATTLIAIQRMALLSSFFTLAGITCYLYFSLITVNSSQLSTKLCSKKLLFTQLSLLFVFTILATLSKENGALLPVFVLIIEITLLSRLVSPTKTDYFRHSVLLLCLFVLFTVLLTKFFANLDISLGRNYSSLERAYTQPLILLKYLKLAFLPKVDAINAFHDNVLIYGKFWNLNVIAPLITISTLMVCALKWRIQYPILSFAILWFFGAHLIESTILPLEPMFLHRNYIALIGPCFAIILLATKVRREQKRTVVIIGCAYLSFLGMLTFYTVSLWGNPRIAADAWYEEQKGSNRATDHFVKLLLNNGEDSTALKVMERHLAQCKNCINSELKAVVLACVNRAPTKESIYLNRSKEIIRNKAFSPEALLALPMLLKKVQDNSCSVIKTSDLIEINEKLLEHNNLSESYQRRLHENLFNIAIYEGNVNDAFIHIQNAWQISQSHKVAEMYLDVMIEQGKIEKALNFASTKMCATLPNRPFLNESALARCQAQVKRIKQLSN